MAGWIKLHRKLLEWEWYSKPVVKSVFIHSLLRANHKDGKWQGKDIKRGSFISSIDKLASELGHSRQEIRTALKHLKSTNELTTIGNTQHTVFIVINYDNYQEETSEATNEQPTANQRLTTNKNVKNDKNINTIDYDLIMNSFNSAMSKHKEVPSCAKMNPVRIKAINKLIKSLKINESNLVTYFAYIAKTDSWSWSRNKSGGYTPQGIDYFLREAVYIKASEEV